MGGSKSLELDHGPILLGSSAQCQISFGSGHPGIKAIIQSFVDENNQEKVLFSSLDPFLRLHYKEEAFSQLLLKEDDILSVVIGQISISSHYLINKEKEKVRSTIEQVDGPPIIDNLPSLPSYKLPEKLFKPKSWADLPEEKGRPFNVEKKRDLEVEKSTFNQPPQEGLNLKSEQLEDKNHNILNFNTIFDEDEFGAKSEVPFIKPLIDYSNFIDPEDETVIKLPTPEVIKKNDKKAIQIIHMNNGVVLNEQTFSLDLKRIYLRRGRSDKRSFQVHDLNEKSIELVYIKQKKVYIDCLKGYVFQNYHPDLGLLNIDKKTYLLELESERVVFTKGTGQVFIRIVNAPPVINNIASAQTDDLLIGCVGGMLSLVLIPMLLLMTFINIEPDLEKKKDEIAVVYKRAKPKVIEIIKKDFDELAEKEPEVMDEKIEVKKEQPPKKNIAENINKITKKNKIMAKNMKKVKRKKVKKISKTENVLKIKKEKTYKFNTSKMMKNVMSKPSRLISDVDDSNSSFNEVLGKNEFKIKKTITNLDTKRKDVNSYRNKDSKKIKTNFNVRNISSKTKTQTSYRKTQTKILGAVDPGLIKKLLREYIPHFRHCYQKELLRNSNVTGIFNLDFQISSKGHGEGLKITNSKVKFSNKGIHCLSTVVGKIKFPRPRGGGTVDVIQPLNFHFQSL